MTESMRKQFWGVVFAGLGAFAGYRWGAGACLGVLGALALLLVLQPRDAGNEETVPIGSFPHACPSCRQVLLFHRHDDGRACVEHWGAPCEWYRRPEVTADVVAATIDRPGERGALDRRAPAN